MIHDMHRVLLAKKKKKRKSLYELDQQRSVQGKLKFYKVGLFKVLFPRQMQMYWGLIVKGCKEINLLAW